MIMLRLEYLIFIAAFLVSCGQASKKVTTKTLDFDAFTIEVPVAWQKEETQGVDSHVGNIIIDSADTISFDLGHYSNPLTEREPQVWERESLKYHPQLDTNSVILVNDHKAAKEVDQYRKQNLLWDTVDGREVKIVYPRKAENGITGIYIDSLWRTRFGTDRFNLRGGNLKPENQRLVLQAVKTIKFRKPD